MSDFLVSLGGGYQAEVLLKLLRLPYGDRHPEGSGFDYAWGSAAVLCDRPAPGDTVFRNSHGVFAWVGDLIGEVPKQGATALMQRLRALSEPVATPVIDLSRDEAFEKLNGAFAALYVSEHGPSVITDPLGSVQVYAGGNRDGQLMALGTHPDLVAMIADPDGEVDPVSVFEFLNVGTPCFPHTMHTRVQELAPGRLHRVVNGAEGQSRIAETAWWPFPDEYEPVPDEAELAIGLEKAFLAAVQDRCQDGPVGVTLSGGLDSRLVMAAVPDSIRCVGFTFCDVINREARIARRVAQCYQREWVPLYRDDDYIARTAMDTVRFIGCEGDWVNAHGLGFAAEIAQHEVATVLTGLLMNNNVKGYYAADVQRVPRGWGLLPPRYDIVPYDYVSQLKAFSASVFRDGLLEAARARRKAFLTGHPGTKRQSVAEWLDGYPFSQAADNTAWVAERRLMPVRLPAMDRRLLDLACRIPMRVKAGGRLFTRMATGIFGKGARIPDANDGVRPGSSHVWRLLQRAVRKAENNGRETLDRLGVTLSVPTSWHDYQRYWRESPRLRELLAEHGKSLQAFEGGVFKCNAPELLRDRSLYWEQGFRLVQLALWNSTLRQYRSEMVGGEAKRPGITRSATAVAT